MVGQKSKFKQLKKVIRNNPDTFATLKTKVWFLSWLKINISAYYEFEKLAILIHTEGMRKRYSARTITHQMRWHSLFQEEMPTKYKVSDHATPWLARLVMLTNPKLKGLFTTK